MHMNKVVDGLPQIKMSKHLCENCSVAKKTRKLLKHDFPMKSKQKLEIIHSYVCRPFEVK